MVPRLRFDKNTAAVRGLETIAAPLTRCGEERADRSRETTAVKKNIMRGPFFFKCFIFKGFEPWIDDPAGFGGGFFAAGNEER
jgi:hypothetical protein